MGLFPKSLHAVSALGFEFNVALFVLAYSFDCYFKLVGTLWRPASPPAKFRWRRAADWRLPGRRNAVRPHLYTLYAFDVKGVGGMTEQAPALGG